MTLTSCRCVTLDPMLKEREEVAELAKLYIVLSAYTVAVTAIGTILNLSLLKYAILKRQNSSVKQTNTILNSVVSLSTNNPMRRYYYKMFYCKSEVKIMQTNCLQ